jgi:hypothetical protein
VADSGDDFKTDTRAEIREMRGDIKELMHFKSATWWIGVAIGVVVGLFAHPIVHALGFAP